VKPSNVHGSQWRQIPMIVRLGVKGDYSKDITDEKQNVKEEEWKNTKLKHDIWIWSPIYTLQEKKIIQTQILATK